MGGRGWKGLRGDADADTDANANCENNSKTIIKAILKSIYSMNQKLISYLYTPFAETSKVSVLMEIQCAFYPPKKKF